MESEEEAKRVVDSLESLPRLLNDAAEYGAGSVQDYFRRNGETLDRSLAPHILRHHFMRYLEENAWRIPRLELKRLPNNGISFQYGGHHFRAWKRPGPSRDLPVPGRSASKNAFLRQQPPRQTSQLDMWKMLGFEREEWRDNLVLLWEVDGQYQFEGLLLARPALDPTGQADIATDWLIPLEHPVVVMDREASHTEQTHEVPNLPIEVLDDEVKVRAKPEGER